MSTASSTEAAPRKLEEVNKPGPWWSAPFSVWSNLWKHWFLVRSFVGRDLRIRYSDSLLGYLWSLIEPLLLTLIYYVLFIVVAHKPQPQYAVWILIGVLVWSYFTAVLNGAVGSLTKNAGIIQQVYFPREIFALSSAGSALVICCLSLIITIPMLLYWGARPSIYYLMVPAGLFLAGSFALGLGLACACLNAVHRDVEHFFRFVTKAGFFLSPVMWTLDLPKAQAHLDKLLLNPVALPISMVRRGLEGRDLSPVSTGHVVYSVAICIGAFIIGSMFFKRFEAEAVKNV